MIHYKKEQIAYGFIAILSIFVMVLGGFTVISTFEISIASLFVFFLLLIFLFYRLVVVIDDSYLKITYGIGLIKFKWELKDLKESEVVRNKWWYGWGIRLTPHGWLYNISGLSAVEILKGNGKRFRIGTAEPHILKERLDQKLG